MTIQGLRVFICKGCGRKTMGDKPPAACGKCKGIEFDEEEYYQTRPMTTESHREILKR